MQCEVKTQNLTAEYYANMKSFLDSFCLTALQAQIILEVCSYKEYYIDIATLQKKLPKELKSNNVEEIIKDLIQSDYLQPYEAKKKVFCVRSAPLGRDITREIRGHCFSNTLRYFDQMEKKYGLSSKLLCYDPQGFKIGDERSVDGPFGKIWVAIKNILASDEVFDTTGDGKLIYERKLVGIIKQCPRCHSSIKVSYCYSPQNCYTEPIDVCCNQCSLKFKLARSLLSYYE